MKIFDKAVTVPKVLAVSKRLDEADHRQHRQLMNR